MKTNDVFPSKYLKAEDDLFDNGEVVATIKDVTLETMRGGQNSGNAEQSKPVMFFKELPKGLVMNKTNWGICTKLFSSDDSDDWNGQRVALNVIETVAYGEAVKSIRVSEKKPVADKKTLMERYQKLWERGNKAGLDGIGAYTITPDMTEAEIMELGKELKGKVEAAEAFA